jgi:hypothetical protein
VLAVPLGLAMWLDPKWIAFFAVPTPDAGLLPHTASLVGFGLAFGAGFLIDRRRDLLDRIATWSPIFLAVAVVTGVAAWYLAGGPVIEPMVEPTEDKAVAAWTVALAVYSSAFAAMGLCLRDPALSRRCLRLGLHPAPAAGHAGPGLGAGLDRAVVAEAGRGVAGRLRRLSDHL